MNNQNNNSLLLLETLEYHDMVGLIKPTIHIDEFASKMGDDDEVVVVSFFVRSKQAARDLVNWFEKGYDFVMDADQSPGEISPGRYLVYVELRRRTNTGKHIHDLIEDLTTLTDIKPNEWIMHYEDEEYPFTVDEFNRLVPSSPKEYRDKKQANLNEMRVAAGIPPRRLREVSRDLRPLQAAAGI